ncbi:MAG: hydrogenase nickel incorporation protein HypB [Pseudomonadota bacterium]
MIISVEKAVTAQNDLIAARLRERLGDEKVFCLNLIAAPGAGKTSLIEKTIAGLGGRFGILVVEGDPRTSLDGDRVTAAGARAFQINTLGGCHLDARMVQVELDRADLGAVDLLIIENIGNLLCPAAWDLGEDVRVVVSSLPEGADKPLKYPETFSLAQVLVINKIDLGPFLPVKAADIRAAALRVNPGLEVFEVSCLTGAGLDQWLTWLGDRVGQKMAELGPKDPLPRSGPSRDPLG